ncbi:hypothetical protein BT63DRAFT_458051 [Microthyrium microscopicum]|uniref:Uncharacterized protein n=1 Tax=Microthyrium microscopicum TaxID=703497 RepID=A0A6A6U7L8_9PEZI|nr:hypothetical protein BT63DRAFT_458051 [Microthyrium microscopicum]
MGAVSEILRFVLPRTTSSNAAFSEVRRLVAANGLGTSQYFGYIMEDEGFPRPKAENFMCWYIEWPNNSSFRNNEEFRSKLVKLSVKEPRLLRFQFQETKSNELTRALESSACQFAVINLAQNAPRGRRDFEKSMEKTFTDCYFAEGFEGGGWGYAQNTNDADGEEMNTSDSTLPDDKRMLAYYMIGWKSLADHHAYAKTELYDEEIDKLMPYFGPGTGAFYVKFEKHE